MKKIFISLFAGLFMLAFSSNAKASQLFGNEYSWHYLNLNNPNYFTDSNMGDVSFFYNDVNWSGSESWATSKVLSSNQNSDYLLKTTVNLGSDVPVNMYLNARLSEGDRFKVFLNGNALDIMTYYEGYGNADSQYYGLNPGLFKKDGINDISVFFDHKSGDNNVYFDLQISTTPVLETFVPELQASSPVPEPSSMILGFLGLGSMLGLRRKRVIA